MCCSLVHQHRHLQSVTYLYTRFGSVHNPWSSPVHFCHMNTVWYCNQIYSYISPPLAMILELVLCRSGWATMSHLVCSSPYPLVTYQLFYPSTPELEGTHVDCGMPQQLYRHFGLCRRDTAVYFLAESLKSEDVQRVICRFAPMPFLLQ